MTDTLTIRRPDDWHLHLRDGDMLRAVLPFTADVFGRAIIMPNLTPPVACAADAAAYRNRIMAALPPRAAFEPLMTAYLTDGTDPDDLAQGHADVIFTAAKLYPAGATTNSDNGVTDLANIHAVLATMERIGMPLLVHGEVTDPAVDIFDREKVFIDRVLKPALEEFSALKVVFEHITTAEGVDFVRSAGANVAATITPHHLVINRNALFAGGMRPHMFCLPVAKRETHRLDLLEAATSGNPTFFLGTDSAPHVNALKEAACGCAGCYTAPVTMPLLAEVFEAAGALDQLESFTSLHGAGFYGVPPSEATLTFTKGAPVDLPRRVPSDAGPITIFDPGFPVHWSVTP